MLTLFKVIISLTCLPLKAAILSKDLITDWLFLRIYCATIAPWRGKRGSIGSTINVEVVDLTIPRWLRLAQVPDQQWLNKLQCILLLDNATRTIFCTVFIIEKFKYQDGKIIVNSNMTNVLRQLIKILLIVNSLTKSVTVEIPFVVLSLFHWW